MQQRVDCKREGSVKICIQDGDAELWHTTFKSELVEVLKKTTKSLESTEDVIEDALIGSTDQIQIQLQENIVQEIGSQ